MPAWHSLASDFRKYHTHPVNVLLHLITTPAAIVGLTAAAVPTCGVEAVACIHALWVLCLVPAVPFRLLLASALIQAGLCAAAIFSGLSGTAALVLFAVAYVGQELAHYATCESTYQSSYQGQSGAMSLLFWHTLYLIPLCVDACFHTSGAHTSLASLVVQRRQMPYRKLGAINPQLLADAQAVGAWACAQKPPTHQTTHWWPEQLSSSAEAAFKRVARSGELMASMWGELFPSATHVVEPLEGMNEVYVACKTHNNNSDTVFYMNHVDGPYGIFPLVHVFRCMCGATPNGQIETIFPMQGKDDATRYALSTGDIVGFDFHRELHRIGHVPGAPENAGHRVCLKLHYLVYPRALGPLGRLLGRMTVHYNLNFRKLFVATISPNSYRTRFLAWCTHAGTVLFNGFEVGIGWGNVVYLLISALCSLAARSYAPFFFLTSFMHYCVYISTYHQRRNIAFGAFKRDALLYKTLALTQAGIQYLMHLDLSAPDYASLAMIVTGFGLATMAAAALGVDRTYFGWELGEIKGGYVSSGFPYGYVPHPMILGGIVGWMGIGKLEGFMQAWPYYAPLHVALYLVHATQEHFAVHTTGLIQAGASLPKQPEADSMPIVPAPAAEAPVEKPVRRAKSPGKKAQ